LARLGLIVKSTLGLFAFILYVLSHGPLLGEEPTRILLVVGPSNHPPGTHEVAASARLLADCLEKIDSHPNIEAIVLEAWPSEAERNTAATLVFLGDTFPANRFPNAPQNLADLDVMMQRGCGIVCLHFATGLLGNDVNADGDHPLLRWMGGYYANRSCAHHQSIARIFKAATITPAADHPINRGWKQFTLHDEPYINNYFGPKQNQAAANVTILATSLLPPEMPQPERIAWCVQREDSGRGFGIVMPHFYRNWGEDDLRKFILNGIVWSAKLDIPVEGIVTPKPQLESFSPAAVSPSK
jgi:type 1 glutamine amidotransferase